MTGSLVQFDNFKSFQGKYNARRPDKKLKFNAELEHFTNQVWSSQDERLPVCTQASFQLALLEAAGLGLTWNKRMGHCYPVRYKDQCTLMVGYQGLIHLVMKAGTLKSIQPMLVCKDDPVFDPWIDERGVHIKHQMARDNRGPITHAYCTAHFTNGDYHVEIMGIDDLARVKAAAKTQKIWSQWEGPMCMKSVIRRAWKFWPKDDAGVIETAINTMDKYEPMDFGDAEPVDETPQYVTITEDQELTLHSRVFEFYAENQDPAAEKTAGRWMDLLCQTFGIKRLSEMPADRYDEAVVRIEDRITRIKEDRFKKLSENGSK